MAFSRIASALLLAGGMASAHAGDLLTENFDSVAALGAAGWTLSNQSFNAAIVLVGGDPWFQGNAGVFTAQAGADDAYIASNYLAAPDGGFIDNYLITPTFSLETDILLTFWARGEILDGFADTFAVLAGVTAGGSPESISTVLGETVAVGDWTQYSVKFGAVGAGAVGRFAFEYFGPSASANYVGIDTVNVAAIPEPQTYALMGLGLAAIAFIRRRRSAV